MARYEGVNANEPTFKVMNGSGGFRPSIVKYSIIPRVPYNVKTDLATTDPNIEDLRTELLVLNEHP